ncbi:DNA cytosine methyltransferase [Microbacterium sp. NPDC087592]|uniref:DNA cytosine methyltransferase n=1 Tax=Microbacterium sp. NPDC087592 TaxID=3364193 RepID=UPI00382E5D55
MGSSGVHSVVEICAGAGGQSLGLHKAGFEHRLAVEIDETAAKTLRQNLDVEVAVGDAADSAVWVPSEYSDVSLLAGGVPCPPFSVAGKQLGSSDERDLFAWAIEQVAVMRPRAVMLENVRGLASPRFSAYRQRVLDRLDAEGYVGEWRLLYSSDFGVAQLRPRFVLIAMSADDHRHFHWPESMGADKLSVGEALHPLMASDGWIHADEWRLLASGVGPTLVGGSKKHGGADLGPTRAKQAWAQLYVDGRGIADRVPVAEAPSATEVMPRLTIEMAARIQGWLPEDGWSFAGRKTSQYRQIGNAFPPPVALAVGKSIIAAFEREGTRREGDLSLGLHDPVYRALSSSQAPMSLEDLVRAQNEDGLATVERKLAAIGRDFELEVVVGPDGAPRYSLGEFRGFIGQQKHARHSYITENRSKVS